MALPTTRAVIARAMAAVAPRRAHQLASSPLLVATSPDQRRLQSTQPPRSKTSASPFSRQQQQQQPSPHQRANKFKNNHHHHDSVVSQLESRAAVDRNYEPDLAFLRQAATLLQSVQSPDELRAALPLCQLVEHAETLHGFAAAECVRIYEALGRDRDAVELARRLLRSDFFLTNPVLISALQACASLGDAPRGFELFELACARGTNPTRGVFYELLGLSAMAGDAPTSPRVAHLLKQMNESGATMTHTRFHHWMSSHAKAGHYSHVQELFDTIAHYGLQPVEYTYAIVMDKYAAEGDFDKTLDVFTQFQKDAPRLGLEVALVHYNVALKACGRAKKLSKAFFLYEEMKDKKITPDLVTYITMMHAVYHGELGVIDTRKVKAAMGGIGAMALASVPFMDLENHFMTLLFCSSLVGSMGLAVYMNPDGAMRALYPNSDEAHHDTVIEAFFRRLREEDHCGRSMYLWQEMRKHGIAPEARVYDVLVRTCVKKRHPELAFEALFEQQTQNQNQKSSSLLVDQENNNGQFLLGVSTTVAFLQSLLSQRRMLMADTVFDQARSHRAFGDLFRETKDAYTYDLRPFRSQQVRSYVLRRVLTQLHSESKLFGGSGKTKQQSSQLLPRIEFITHHGNDLLDQVDMDDAQVRTLFAMDEMTVQSTHPSRNSNKDTNKDSVTTHSGAVHHFHRLSVPRDRLAAFFAAPLLSATQQKL